jgi:hypothetical protein
MMSCPSQDRSLWKREQVFVLSMKFGYELENLI